ncbi:hypothetical protein ACLQ26_08155 [Micromonospora sp. DT43]|uniref:hypothetical protein n=1 Tax=Micromonospora sp. DT43 TaxID=3393440 RepID=UPI003CF3F676
MSVNHLTRSAVPPFLPAVGVPADAVAEGWPTVWWIGCHGGSGSSTLARLTGLGRDFPPGWPLFPPAWPIAEVVLVCRASATGVLAATGAVEQWRRRAAPPQVRVRGLVAVAASPRKPPRIVVERLQLLAGWVPALWRVGWQEVLLAADDPTDVGIPHDVAALRDSIVRVMTNN